MTRMRQALVVLVATLVVVAGAGPALAGGPAAVSATAVVASTSAVAPTAVDADGCREVTEGYAAPAACQLLVAEAQGICVADAPVLEYAVQPEGTPNDTLTVTWVNPDGADLVQSGLPLSGQLLWPGTVVQDGAVVDWPGWTLDPDGVWENFDSYSWTRPEVQVIFEVNPSATTTVSYPSATSACAGPRLSQVLAADVDASSSTGAAGGTGFTSAVLGTEFSSAVLAATGLSAGPVVGIGAGLLVLGALLVLTAARRRHHRHHLA
ncbi:MAG TPA: peptidase [Cellulomonas sp.]